MIEELRHVFDDIRNSIIEMGVDVDECVSPEEYAYRIKLINGNNAVTCIPVFKSSAEKPETPTKVMSSNNPTDYPYGWSTPDELTDDIWMTYTIVGPEKVYVPWTTPVLIYSTGSSSPQPRIEPGSTRIFLIYAEWTDRDVELDLPQGGHWNVEENILEGPITSIVRKNNTATGDVVYWNDNNVHEAGSFTWLSTGTFLASDGNLIGEWSDPVCINYAKDGKNGRNGVDGDNVEFIYKLFQNIEELNNTPAPVTPESKRKEDDFVPDGWTDSPQAIDAVYYPIEGMSTRSRDKVTKEWGDFIKPIPWAVWGQDGTDGDGVEYIFRVVAADRCRLNDDGSWTLVDPLIFPPMNKNQYLAKTQAAGVDDDVALLVYQNDEFIPGQYPIAQSVGWDDPNWTDDPSDVSENEPLEFVSIRKYRKNSDTGESEWGWYSEPKLWNKWAYVDTSIFTAFAFTRTNENLDALDPPLVIEGGDANNPIPNDSTYTKDGAQVTVKWEDTVPDGMHTVWMTMRTMGQPNSTWSSPIRMADTADFQVEYSASLLPDGVSTQLPSLNNYIDDRFEEGVDEDKWRRDCAEATPSKGVWNDNVRDPLWMATCARNNGSWSDWVISKVRGENTIRVDLTNDKDELIYDHDGRKVSLRNSETTAHLYDGATEVTSNITWSISKATGANRYNSGAAISVLPQNPEANTAYITTDGNVLLSGIMAGNEAAVITIKAAYNGSNYYADFVVGKKVGEDNYELYFTPNVLTYNKTTGVPADSEIRVTVKKESYIDGKVTVADAMPTGYKVFLYNSDVDQEWTDVEHTAHVALNANSKTLKLLLATAKTGGTIEDGPEDINVLFVENGDDGRGIVSVTNYYMWYNNGTSHPAESASGWKTSIPAAPSDENYKYLWKKIVTAYSDNTSETTYELISERGARGPIGARMRMRNWSTDYSNLDPDGQSGWQCGNNPNDAFYDIAIWPNTEDISITGVTDDPSKLWRCIKNLDYNQVTPGSTPEDYPLNFTQAVGWDFIATKLLLAQRISADQIDARGISVDVLVTTPDEDGGYIDIRGNRMLMKNGSTEVCKITGDELELSADHSSQYAWGERLGSDFAEAVPGSSSTFGVHFERPIGRITVPQTAGTQTDYFASDHKQHIGLRIEGIADITDNFAPGENICGMSVFIKATNVNTGQVIQWHTGGYAEQGALPYKDSTSAIHFNEGALTLLGYDFELDTTEHKTLSPGTYDITITGDGWGPVLRDHHSQKIVLSQYQSIKNGNPVPPANWENYEGFFSPIIWHHTSVNGAQTTEIAADGFGHVLDGDNYFYVRHFKENGTDTNTLVLEFLTNGTFGLQISKNGIKYTKTGPDPQNWIDLV